MCMTEGSRRTERPGYIALASPVSRGGSLIHRLPLPTMQQRRGQPYFTCSTPLFTFAVTVHE
jgi:hypothetical protein